MFLSLLKRFVFALTLSCLACGGGSVSGIPGADNSNTPGSTGNSDGQETDSGNEVDPAPVVPVDITPETTIASGPASQTTSTSASFMFASNSTSNFYQCRIDSDPFESCTSPYEENNLIPGVHTFEVIATDANGQTDPTPAAYSWQVIVQTPPSDTQAPETSIISGPGSQTTSTSATFSFDANEPATFACSLDNGGYTACSSPRMLSGLSLGSHTFSVRATDSAGNADATPASFSWQVIAPPDTTPPQTTIISGPASSTTSRSASFAFSSNEAGSFQCQLDGVAVIPCTSPRTFTNLSVAAHQFQVFAIDTAGNSDPTPATYSWTITNPPDTIPPETSITAGPADPTGLTDAEFSFSSDDPAATFQCNLDNGGYSACTSPESFPSLDDGNHTFSVRATDAAGNTDLSPASFSWEITPPPSDTQPPQTSIDSGPTDPTTATAASFAFSADEAASFECNLDDAGFIACISPRVYNSLDEGGHTFEVRAIDGAGNIDPTPASASWQIDPSFGLIQRVPFAGSNFPSGLADPASLTITDAFPGMTIPPAANTHVQPVHMVEAPDGTNRFFMALKDGRIQYFSNASGTTANATFLDLSGPNPYSPNQVVVTGESGLLGLAFDPDFATNRYYYVYYVTVTGGVNTIRSVVSRFQANADRTATLAGSETILLQTPQLMNNGQVSYVHKAGSMAFGPDNMLYIVLGEGGTSSNAQTLSNLRGKVLRIDPSQPSAGRNYSIPADNPYANIGGNALAGVNCANGDAAPPTTTPALVRCEEIWAYGLRNPWRFGFDRNTGALWLGDVGNTAWEEVNLIVRGRNYGWPRYEGNAQTAGPLDTTGTYTPPVFTYPRASGAGITAYGAAIIGGTVYRGSNMPSLYGKYVFLDLTTRRVWAFAYTGSTIAHSDLATVLTSGIGYQPVGFAEDLDGEIYIVQLSQTAPSNPATFVELYRFAEAPGTPPAPAIPQTLSQTGLFSNTANLTPAAGMIEYDVNSPLWSDWAIKRRWIALPGNQQITFSSTGNWGFPTGTILVKHFELALSSTQTKRLETRVLINDTSGWQGYTYKWNDAQTDAELLPGSASEVLNIGASAPGGARTQTWNYPSRGQCLLCHTSTVDTVLGVRAHQINGEFDYPSITDNQLRSWNNIGLFSTNIGDADQYDALVNINDTSASLTQRVKSYFASNCIQCHSPGPAPTIIDMKYETAVDSMNLKNASPVHGELGLSNARIVSPDNKASSVLWERMRRLDGNRMPPLGTNVVDQNAVDVIGGWIDAGAP